MHECTRASLSAAHPRLRHAICACMRNHPRTRSLTMYHTHRFGQLAVTLRYATRDTFVRGQDDILAKPVLTMAQEFDR